MKDLDKLELIEKYLEGDLTGAELSDMELRIQTDPVFSKEVAWQRQAMEQLADPGMRLFQERLHAYKQTAKEATVEEANTAKVVQMRPMRRVLAIAASLAVLAAVAVWLMWEPAMTSEKLFAEHFALPPANEISVDNTVKGGSGGTEKTAAQKAMAEAVAAYQQKNYPGAIALLNSIPEEGLTQEERPAFLFQKGVFLMANGEHEAAYQLFGREDAGNEYKRQWYRALMLVKLNKTKAELKSAFSEIAASKVSPYRNDAGRVLKDLEKLQ